MPTRAGCGDCISRGRGRAEETLGQVALPTRRGPEWVYIRTVGKKYKRSHILCHVKIIQNLHHASVSEVTWEHPSPPAG